MRPGRIAFLAVALLVAVPSTGRSQALQIQSLQFPTTSVVGPWVSYRVRTQSRALTPRDYTQRVAIVGREKYHGKEGFWVELKTEGLPTGKRIERGFFTVVDNRDDYKNRPGEMADLPPDSFPPPMPPRVRLVRYQVLTSGGKLYEYPVGAEAEARAGSDVGTLELFEYDSTVPPVTESLGPDTLRIGRRVVPTVVERTRRVGSDSWPDPSDAAYIMHPILTQKYWRNAAVPITGFARSLFQVTMERAPAPARDTTEVAPEPGGAKVRRIPPVWMGR
ncbi:MAG TPA: hypothetical protein VJQ53_09250, partial [Candidatus Eisenbacteria bacterium]|nr:hypothetical protein [Candidatus Eisenbacteria bacterium]